MLILHRKKQESILIGDNIRVTVLDLRNGRARIGIDAPENVKIDREEWIGAGKGKKPPKSQDNQG